MRYSVDQKQLELYAFEEESDLSLDDKSIPDESNRRPWIQDGGELLDATPSSQRRRSRIHEMGLSTGDFPKSHLADC